MNIDKKVIDIGITKEVIEFLHGKTKLSKMKINNVFLIRHYKNSITIKLEMTNDKSRYRQMSLDIKESKLKETKRNLVLEKIGI